MSEKETELKMPMERSALFNRKGNHRKVLIRSWNGNYPTKLCTFVMLNPSTAGATEDDPTVRRCIGFAMREGCKALRIVNLFTYRATDPKELLLVDKPKKLNTYDADIYINEAARDSGLIIAGWGALHPSLEWRAAEVLELFKDHKANVWCLGKTAGDQPKHPLYLSKDETLLPYRMAVPTLVGVRA